MTSAPAAKELPPTLLLVDDDEVFRTRLARSFRDRGFDVIDLGDPKAALERTRQDPPELAVVDLRMPYVSGLDLVRGLRQIEPATKIVVFTGYGSIATALQAVRLGAVHYLTKPATVEDILSAFSGCPPSHDSTDTMDAVPSLARVEWEHINRVMTECNGNVSQAARLLKMHRRSLQRKLAKYPVAR